MLFAHAGKRELPGALRSRFTELWVPEPSQQEDLEAVAAAYLQDSSPQPPVQQAVALYRAAKQAAVRAWKKLHEALQGPRQDPGILDLDQQKL